MQFIKPENLQPQEVLVSLQAANQFAISDFHPNFIMEISRKDSKDNSGCLTQIFSFKDTEDMDAGDAAIQALEIAKAAAWELSKYLNTQNRDSIGIAKDLESFGHLIYNAIDDLNYFTVTIMATDATLYITAIYNQQ